MTADFADWTAPQAHATAISTTGAPLLVMKQVIDVLIGQAINAGASVTRPASGLFSLNQPGYEIQLNVATLGGTAPIVSVELQWYDSTFGALMDDEIYWFYSGNVNGHLIHGRGPTKGDRVVVIITNRDATSQITVSYTLLQTSRVFTREFWKTITKATVAPVFPGFTATIMDPSSNVLSAESHLVAANTSLPLVLPLYTGTARLFGVTGDTVVGNSKWEIAAATDKVTGNQLVVEAANGESAFAPFGPTSAYVADVGLPRSQCQLTIVNGNASSSELITTAVIAQEDRA